MIDRSRSLSTRGSLIPVALVVSDALTLDVVAAARQRQAQLIVTRPSSPYCHAANVLRYCAARDETIAWRVSHDLPAKQTLHFDEQGRWTMGDDGERVTYTDRGWKSHVIGVSHPGTPRLQTLAFAGLMHGRDGVIAMTGKRYDPLTASLMVDGLSESATSLAGRHVDVARLCSGQLAVMAPDVAQRCLRTIATRPTRARPFLEAQRETYDSLLSAWFRQRSKLAFETSDLVRAAALLKTFFSVLLLLHETYTEVIVASLERLKRYAEADNLLLAAIPRVLAWQIGTAAGLPTAEKDILEPGGELPVPPFNVAADLVRTQDAVERVLGGSIDAESLQWASHLVLVMVLKEWKFFLAKAVHRHFGRVTATLLRGGQVDWVRAWTFPELMGKLESS
jgi:hypothetical protein